MKPSIRPIFALLLILLLAGCAVPAQPAVTPAIATESVTSGETHTITHAMGKSDVPVNPQRVVVLDTGELDNALALGASIIGAPVAEALEYQAYLADQLDGITDTGAISEPSLETILTLKPDLILGSKQRHEAIYEQLSAIAPTVFTESLRVPWQANFKLHAEALGQSDKADELLATYDARTAQIQEALGDTPPTISIIRFRPGQVRLYLKRSYIGYILQDVGLPRPPAQDQDIFSSEISLEQIADVDADYIFITGYAQDDSDQETFLQSELWTTLGAVQNGHAIDVNDDTWIAGLGVQSANLVLDDLIDLLGLAIAETPPTTTTDAAFPVTIEHKYDTTTIEAKPERIVTVGLTDQDALLALGIVPVGTSEWFGGYPGSIWPWAQDELAALGGETPTAVGGDSINFEAIAGLRPDLILALYAGVTQEEYDLLTQIAPTVAQPVDYVDYGIPWQELTLTVGKAVGQAKQAEALVAAVEGEFDQVRAAHPEFEGATSIVATPYQGIWVYGDQDVRGRFLTMLGFQLPAGLQEVTGTEFGGNLSMERADLLDVDVIIWLDPEDAEGELGGPVYQSLSVHMERREIFLDSYDDPLGGATSFVTVLSLPYLLDGLVPQLANAMGLTERATGNSTGNSTRNSNESSIQVLSATATERVIRHADGRETTIPTSPQCIVTAGSGYPDHLLALGVKPCGAAHGPGGSGFPAHLADQLTDVEYVGGTLEVNLERVLLLDPDLILAMHPEHTEGNAATNFDPVAPTIYLTQPWADWRQTLKEIGLILGKTAEAEAALAAFDVSVAEANATLSTAVGTEKVAFLRVLPQEIRVYGTASPTGDLLFNQLGLAPAALVPIGEHAQSISLELIPELDADHIFLLDQTEDGMATLNNSPLWQTVPAVAADNLYPVNVKIWVQGEGLFAYEQLVADVLTVLRDRE